MIQRRCAFCSANNALQSQEHLFVHHLDSPYAIFRQSTSSPAKEVPSTLMATQDVGSQQYRKAMVLHKMARPPPGAT